MLAFVVHYLAFTFPRVLYEVVTHEPPVQGENKHKKYSNIRADRDVGVLFENMKAWESFSVS